MWSAKQISLFIKILQMKLGDGCIMNSNRNCKCTVVLCITLLCSKFSSVLKQDVVIMQILLSQNTKYDIGKDRFVTDFRHYYTPTNDHLCVWGGGI